MERKRLVPKWVRVVVGLLAAANVLFGISNYVRFDVLFQNSREGIDLAASGARFASYEFGARNLAIGLALLIVALVGVPEAIAIVTIIRALIELQAVVIALIAGTVGIGTLVAVIMLVVELWVVKTMVAAVARGERLG